MKILQVLEAAEGGTRTHMKQILTGLCSDFEFHLAYSLERNPGYRDDIKIFESLGVVCTEVPMVRRVSLFRDRSAIRAVRDILERWKPDILHTHSSKAGFVGRRAVRGKGVKSVYTPHCLYFPSQKGIPRLLYRWGERINEKHTDRFIAVSESEKRDLLRDITVDAKIARINNGVEIPLPSEGIREKRIVFTARAAKQKGWDLFLRIAQMVLLKEKDAKFLFAGKGPDLEKMRKTAVSMNIEEQVEIPGFRENAGKEYQRACAGAVTSRWEAQPYSVLEAMSCSCPVVAFDIPGMNELIEDGVNGCLVKPFDCRAFADALLSLLGESVEAGAWGSAGLRKIEAQFTKQKFLEEMKAFYIETGKAAI